MAMIYTMIVFVVAMLACFGIGFCLKARELRKTAEAQTVKKHHAQVAFQTDNSAGSVAAQ